MRGLFENGMLFDVVGVSADFGISSFAGQPIPSIATARFDPASIRRRDVSRTPFHPDVQSPTDRGIQS